MTEEKMREALEKANCALREASFFVGSHGFLHAAGQLQAVADDVVAALTKQEGAEMARIVAGDYWRGVHDALRVGPQILALKQESGEVSRSQTARALELVNALEWSFPLLPEFKPYIDRCRAIRAALPLPAPPVGGGSSLA
jgi:hypothetical protein